MRPRETQEDLRHRGALAGVIVEILDFSAHLSVEAQLVEALDHVLKGFIGHVDAWAGVVGAALPGQAWVSVFVHEGEVSSVTQPASFCVCLKVGSRVTINGSLFKGLKCMSVVTYTGPGDGRGQATRVVAE